MDILNSIKAGSKAEAERLEDGLTSTRCLVSRECLRPKMADAEGEGLSAAARARIAAAQLASPTATPFGVARNSQGVHDNDHTTIFVFGSGSGLV